MMLLEQIPPASVAPLVNTSFAACDTRDSVTSLLGLIEPLIDDARCRLQQQLQALANRAPEVPFDHGAITEQFVANIRERLLSVLSPTLVLELNVARLEGLLIGNTPQARFQSFTARLREPAVQAALLQEYRVLANQVRLHLDHWVTSSFEVLNRLCAEWDEIRSTVLPRDPGTLTKVNPGKGDRHKRGRSVTICEFNDGQQLVYKPRSLAVDVHFREVLQWLNGFGLKPDLRLFDVLDCGDHGWTGFVSPRPCTSVEEVTRFYYRQGAYLALLYALEACDFHCENLLAEGEYPMLLDLEAIIHPSIVPEIMHDPAQAAALSMGYSVMKVGLLPQKVWFSEDNPGLDISGFGGEAGQSGPNIPFWKDAATDEMRAGRRRMKLPAQHNLPTLNNVPTNALEHSGAVTDGFSAVYRLIMQNRDGFASHINSLAHDELRVITRGTRVYAHLLQQSFHPDVLRTEAERDALFDGLHAAVSDCPTLAALIPFERADLWNGDIPFFSTRPQSRSLWSSVGEEIPDYLPASGLELVRRRVDQLSEQDLERQIWILRASLATLGTAPEGRVRKNRSAKAPVSPATREMLLAGASAVGDWLQKQAIESGESVSWLGLSVAGENQWQLGPLSLDLYDGLSGVALFLAHLGALTRNHRYTSLARAAVRSLLAQLKSQGSYLALGGFSGWGGVVYTLAHLAHLWGDSSLLHQATVSCRSIPSLVPQDMQFDVIGGSAGCILGVSSLHKTLPSETTMSAMLACGNRLLETAQPQGEGIGWFGAQLTSKPLAGFAHGNAGIAYALNELAAVTGQKQFSEAARRALDYERQLFIKERGNWADLRFEETRCSIAWCHGAPGIALARLRSLHHSDGTAVRAEIDIALLTALSGFGRDHTLCHGDMGLVDILLEASTILGDCRWQEQGFQAGAEVLADINRDGWICSNPLHVESPGLMTGLAGIGYGLLRLADPDRVPSVLALAPPCSHE